LEYSEGRPAAARKDSRKCAAALKSITAGREGGFGLATTEASEVNNRFELLTNRERQIYQLLAEGNSNKEIANRLNLSLHTVETHRWRIMEKLDLHSTAKLVLSAVRRGMVT
jgi:DNA-binding NarL/FixJ family response regulator